MATIKKDERKYFVVRVKGMDETILKVFGGEGAAVDYMNHYGKKNRTGIIAVVKGDLSDDGEIINREQIGVYDEWLTRILKM